MRSHDHQSTIPSFFFIYLHFNFSSIIEVVASTSRSFFETRFPSPVAKSLSVLMVAYVAGKLRDPCE